MDSTAILSKTRRSRAVRSAAWKGVAEALERRVFLSAGVSKPVDSFIVNDGQWADPTIRYALPSPNGNIFMTDSGPVFQLLQTQKDGTRLSESFFVTFDGSNTVRPTGVSKGDGVYNFFIGDSSTWRTNVAGYDEIAYEGIYDGVDLHTWGRSQSLKYEFHVDPGADWEQVQVTYNGIKGLSVDSKGRLHIKTELGEVIDDAPLVYQNINGKRVVIESSFKLVDNDTYTFDLHGSYDPRYELVLDPEIDWSNYLGSPAEDHVNSVATYQTATEVFAYLTGYTDNSLSFPILDGQQFGTVVRPGPGSGTNDVFVSKVNSSGTLSWSTFIGGQADDDIANDIAIDSQGRVVIVGETGSSDFTFTIGAEDNQFGTNQTNGNLDAFIARFGSDGTLQYSSYLGSIPGSITATGTGTGAESATSVAIDANNFIYVAGRAGSTGFSTVMPDLATTTGRGGTQDGFIAKMNLDQSPRTIWRRYLGGTGNGDVLNSIAVSSAGDIYVAGTTNSNNNNNANPAILPGFSSSGFITIGAYQTLYGGGNSDAYVAKLDNDGALLWGTYLGGAAAEVGNALAINTTLNEVAVTGQTGSTDFDVFPSRATPSSITESPFKNPFTNQPIGNNVRQGTNDAFLTRMTMTAGLPTMSAYLGGSGNGDTGTGLVYKGTDLIVVGNTDSANFPIIDFQGTQDSIKGGVDAFLLSVSVTNVINYSFPFGGSAADNATAVAVDGAGGIWLVGFTASAEDTFNLNGRYRTDVPDPLADTTFESIFDVYSGGQDGFYAHFSEVRSAAPVRAPSNLRATALSISSVQLTWVDNSDNETGFRIRRRLAAGGSYQTVGVVGPNVRSFTDTGLLPDTTYVYFVYAFNLTGNSNGSNSDSVTTRGAAVGAPTNLTATARSSGRIDLAWTDNADNETAFEIYRAETSVGIFALIATVGTNVTSYSDVIGLSPGTEYSYRLRATNAFRASNFSNDASATTFSGLFIIPPSNLVGTPLSSTSLQLTWVDNSENELGFSIERSIFGSGIFNEIGTTGAGETTFIDSLVVSGVNYTYRVRAFNGSSFSAYSNITNNDPALSLATPSLVEARATSSSSILVTWFDRAIVETGYVVERAIGKPSDFNVIFTSGANVTTFTDTNLLPRTKYFYRVSATDGNVTSAASPAASATTLQTGFLPPPAPSAVRGKALSFSSIRITWQDNSATETAFSIERATTLDGPYATVGTVPSNTGVFTDVGLQDGTVYYYRVVARQGTTESLPSGVMKMRTIVKPRIVVNAVDATGGEPSNRIVFNIRRKDTFAGNLVVFYTLSGTAGNNTDYVKLSGQVTIPDGQPTVDVIVTPKDDTIVENTETVILTLTNNASYKVSPSLRSATGTIADNDGLSASARASSAASSSQGTSVFSKKSLSTIKLLDDLV